MKDRPVRLLIPFFFTIVFSQIQFSGDITASGLFQVEDASEISLPFRFVSFQALYALGDIEIRTQAAHEVRWNNLGSRLDIREFYVTWYPEFGEISIGKQIFAWGMADGNNPTDNLSAYDYHYLFKTGTDRKKGSISASLKVYLGNWQINTVFLPRHEPNRLVFDEDFPVQPPFHPNADQIFSMDNEKEYGVRITGYQSNSDISISWFHGHDRLLTPFVQQTDYASDDNPQTTPTKFGYRRTDVFGLDISNFTDLVVQRHELAIFHTSLDREPYLQVLPDGEVFRHIDVWYAQFVMQFENTTFDDLLLSVQYLGHEILTSDISPYVWGIPEFQMGMGTPFAMLFERVLIISAARTWLDNRLEVKPMLLTDLKKSGYMAGLSIEYSPYEQWTLNCGASLFKGVDHLSQQYIFNKLEVFSNFSLGIKYSF